jgi:hypothetical protein
MQTSKGLAMVGLVLAVAAGVLVASLTVSSNAAVVDGTAISRATLNSDLSAISRSPAFQCVLLADQLVRNSSTGEAVQVVSGAGVGSGSLPPPSRAISIPDPATYSSGFTSYWLNRLIQHTLSQQWLEAHGKTVSPFVLARARANLAAQATQAGGLFQSAGLQPPPDCPTSQAALDSSLPPAFVERQVEDLASQYVVTLGAQGQELSPNTLAAYYAAHRSDFDRVCLAVLPNLTQSEVQQVTSDVAGGVSFQSLVQQNPAIGGQVGCASPVANSYARVAAGLPTGQVGSPIQVGPSTYALIQHLSSTTQPLSSVQNDVVQVMVNAAAAAGGPQVAKLQRNSHVWVDPRYGHWVPAPVFSLETWHGPASGTLLCPAANTAVSPELTRCPPTPDTGAATINVPTSTRGARKG